MFERRIRAAIATACAAALLTGVAGCIPSLNGNDPREPRAPLPKAYGDGDGERAAAPGAATSTGGRSWSELFQSPDLRALVDGALRNNQELNVQLQEIVIAQSEVSARHGEYLPKIGANAGVGVDKVGKHTSQGASDEANGLPDNLGNFTFGLQGSWELDVWGKLRSAARAADLRYRASIEAKNFLVTQLVAEIARSYFELIAVDAQLDLLRRNVALQKDALEVVKVEKQAARVTELAVQRFEAEVLKNEGRIYDLEQERVQTENRINFLVGRYPQSVRRNVGELDAPLPEAIRSGLPSELLGNRPDVRRAELELEAAKLDVKAAKAAFYPALSIEAGVGYRSFNAEHILLTPESLAYAVAGNLTAPLLNRTAITAHYRTANARQLQAVFTYEKTLLQAFTDVTNQLAAIENLKKRHALQSKQVERLARSVEVSGVLFQSARADYMEVLLTRRDSLDAELELVETRRRQLHAVVNVYQALGGGWQSRP